MPAIYDLTGHAQLDESVVEAGADYLEWQTLLAEQVLGATAPAFTGDALELARAALVLQVNYQEATGTDARVLASSTRLGITFRSDRAGMSIVVDPMAAIIWTRAVEVAVGEGQEGAAVDLYDPAEWNSVYTRRPTR